MAKYFGTNGVRGTWSELTPELALRLSQAIGLYFKRGNVLFARDHRLTGESLRHAVLAGLTSVGCDVVDLGTISAPTAEFALRSLSANGLIILTASHNPPEWNGLKVVDANGVAMSKERGEEIEKHLLRLPIAPWDKLGHVTHYANATAEHIAAIRPTLNVEKIKQAKLRLVLDFGNGTVATVAPQLFRSLGCEILTLNSHLDGRFPGRPSEPSEANLRELISAVKATSAHAGIAWDGDGDRVTFVDEKGRYIIGDKVFALCLLRRLQQKKGPVVTTVATSKAIEDVARRAGCKVHYAQIGAPYLSEAMIKHRAVLGGEEVGGIIWPELSLAKDGIATAAKMVEAIAEKPLSAWMAELPVYFNEKTKIGANEKEKIKIIKKMRAYAIKNKYHFIDMDGIRINFDDGWVIIRASGTEPMLRVFAEAKTRERARALMDEYVRLVRNKKKKSA